MPQRYETVYIFSSTLEEAQITERLDKYHALLGGSDVVENVSHWGKRTLAYPIHGATTGHYTVVQFATDPANLAEYERALKLDEGLLRYLLVVNELPVGATVPTNDTEDESAAADDQDQEDT